jgi:dTMP kinase
MRPESGEKMSARRLSRGVFFCFEGIDGAGKTTQAQTLMNKINEWGLEAIYVKEPTDGEWGQKIRKIALHGRDGVTPEEELNYFVRDREEDVNENIAPALAQRCVVIADRYFYSTIAYQSVLGLDEGDIRIQNTGFPVPDMVFILDIPVELGQVRITQTRGDTANLGYEQARFLAEVKKVFDAMPDSNIVRIDGSQPLEAVASAIWSSALSVLNEVSI